MSKYEMVDKASKQVVQKAHLKWGQPLEQFLNDPQPGLYNGYNRGPGDNIEAVQDRCWAAVARLMTTLVDKGILSLDEVFKIADVEHEVDRFEIREVKD